MIKKPLIEQKQNIILLEDDEYVARYLQKLLKKLSKCNAKHFSAPNGDFFDHLEASHVDLFIMDIMLGSKTVNGIQVSEEIISKKRGSIFLFISAYPHNESDFKHLNGKCVYDYMSKPIESKCFVTVVSTLLNVASSYKEIVSEKATPSNFMFSQVDDMRQTYLQLLDEDKAMINKLKSSCLALQINK